MIAECPRVPAVEGRTIAEIAAARRAPAENALIDLLRETDGQVSMIHVLMLDANVARRLQFLQVTIGSDNLGLCAGPEETHAGKPIPGSTGASRRSSAPTSASAGCSAGRPPPTR